MASEENENLDGIKLCTEINLTGPEAVSAALQERPDNVGGISPLLNSMALHSFAPEMAVVLRKLWNPGRTLNISFLGETDPLIIDKVKHFAKKWLEHANLSFEWVDENGDLRISFRRGGSWSYIGTDALLIDKAEPTMNFGWLTQDTSDSEYERVVVHEFGHALGAIHEHQHPDGGIPWNKPKVYAYYARQGWDQDQVDRNIFGKYEMNQLNTTDYDKTSIMHYAVPNELTLGNFSIGWNTTMSPLDKELARRVYP